MNRQFMMTRGSHWQQRRRSKVLGAVGVDEPRITIEKQSLVLSEDAHIFEPIKPPSQFEIPIEDRPNLPAAPQEKPSATGTQAKPSTDAAKSSNLGWWLLGGSVASVGLLALLFGGKKRKNGKKRR